MRRVRGVRLMVGRGARWLRTRGGQGDVDESCHGLDLGGVLAVGHEVALAGLVAWEPFED